MRSTSTGNLMLPIHALYDSSSIPFILCTVYFVNTTCSNMRREPGSIRAEYQAQPKT